MGNDNKKYPVVSIIVPCYNQAQFLSDTLESVYAQTYEHWECIIVNDGSLDNTEDIASNWVKKDRRFRYVFKNNGGVSSARNRGIAESNGEYILPLDGDDKIEKSYIEKALSCFQQNKDIKLVYCKAEKFGEIKGPWKLREYSYNRILFSNMIFCSALFRRVDFNKTSGYSEKMIRGLEDWDFWIGFLEETDSVFVIPEVLFFYRTKKQSRNTNFSKEEAILLKQQIVKNHKEKYERYLANEKCLLNIINLKDNDVSWDDFSTINLPVEKNSVKKFVRKIIMYLIPFGALGLKIYSIIKKKFS